MQDFASSVDLKTEEDTHRLAARFADVLEKGDTILLSGDLGAGKSSFARGFIWHRFGSEIEVPSPTFTIVQTYEHQDADIWHCDLYRISSPDEVIELGLDEAIDEEICLIEWPDRLGELVPKSAIKIEFSPSGAGRLAKISGTNPKLAQVFSVHD